MLKKLGRILERRSKVSLVRNCIRQLKNVLITNDDELISRVFTYDFLKSIQKTAVVVFEIPNTKFLEGLAPASVIKPIIIVIPDADKIPEDTLKYLLSVKTICIVAGAKSFKEGFDVVI